MRLALCWLAVGVVGACAGPQPASHGAPDAASPRVASAAAMARTGQALHGASRADAMAALGPATVLRFDSGYEVWVYRFVEPAPRDSARTPGKASDPRGSLASEAPASELVLLLAPSGEVAKSRVRSPAP
jgi:hypothetical protein